MTDVTRLLENPVEAAEIVKTFVFLCNEKKKVNAASIYKASHKPG